VISFFLSFYLLPFFFLKKKSYHHRTFYERLTQNSRGFPLFLQTFVTNFECTIPKPEKISVSVSTDILAIEISSEEFIATDKFLTQLLLLHKHGKDPPPIKSKELAKPQPPQIDFKFCFNNSSLLLIDPNYAYCLLLGSLSKPNPQSKHLNCSQIACYFTDLQVNGTFFCCPFFLSSLFSLKINK